MTALHFCRGNWRLSFAGWLKGTYQPTTDNNCRVSGQKAGQLTGGTPLAAAVSDVFRTACGPYFSSH
jgi:hypothetical protein